MPFVYVVKAESEEAARRLGIEKWRDRIPAEVGMFPEDVTVEELVAPATEAVK